MRRFWFPMGFSAVMIAGMAVCAVCGGGSGNGTGGGGCAGWMEGWSGVVGCDFAFVVG